MTKIWENLEIKKGINYREADEFLNLRDKIDIIPIDKEGRSIIYLNNLIHFFNGIGVITLSDGDILNYDKKFYNLLNDNEKFCKLILEIFYVCGGLQIKKEKRNKIDFIIDFLKKEYIDNSEHYFLELYPYIRSCSFYCKDMSKKIPTTKNHKHKEDFGGRCLDLLCIKKYVIENVHINMVLSYEELARSGMINLREIMIDNKIPPNPCYHEKYDKDKDLINISDQKNIFEFQI